MVVINPIMSTQSRAIPQGRNGVAPLGTVWPARKLSVDKKTKQIEIETH